MHKVFNNDRLSELKKQCVYVKHSDKVQGQVYKKRRTSGCRNYFVAVLGPYSQSFFGDFFPKGTNKGHFDF